MSKFNDVNDVLYKTKTLINNKFMAMFLPYRINKKLHPVVLEFKDCLLDSISANDIIYAEIAEGGAMGFPGQIIFYMINEERLFYYRTNLSKKDSMRIERLLLSHQDKLKVENIKKGKTIFNYYYGGCGFHVFINKNLSLKKGKGYFVYKHECCKYRLYPSSVGVYDYLVNENKSFNLKQEG